jgi:hypothetical protein
MDVCLIHVNTTFLCLLIFLRSFSLVSWTAFSVSNFLLLSVFPHVKPKILTTLYNVFLFCLLETFLIESGEWFLAPQYLTYGCTCQLSDLPWLLLHQTSYRWNWSSIFTATLEMYGNSSFRPAQKFIRGTSVKVPVNLCLSEYQLIPYAILLIICALRQGS